MQEGRERIEEKKRGEGVGAVPEWSRKADGRNTGSQAQEKLGMVRLWSKNGLHQNM